MFTLSGGHVFPLYDGAVKADPPLRLVDVRHEQTAVFAAEGIARLTRTPGLAVVTAGPGVTNSVSAVTSALVQRRAGGGPRRPRPRLPVGQGRAAGDGPRAAARPGHQARLDRARRRVRRGVGRRGVPAGDDPAPGPGVLSTSRWRRSTARRPSTSPTAPCTRRRSPTPTDVARIAELLATARRPVLVLGSDVWLGGADVAARTCAETLRLPVIANGQARGVLPGGHSLLVSRARSLAFAEADLVIVAGVPLDFRLRYGSFGPKEAPASVVHVADSPDGIATHCPLAASASGDLSPVLHRPHRGMRRPARRATWSGWRSLRGTARAARGGRRPAAGERGRRRSTRCASTASCCASSTTTRWSSATAATSSPSPAASSSRRSPDGGWTRAPTAAWAPASATRWRPGSRTRRPRSC